MSNFRMIWRETGLPWNASVKDVKRGYAALIKRYRPDTHPQEFSDARLGYEAALRQAERLERKKQVEEEARLAGEALNAPCAEGGNPAAGQAEQDPAHLALTDPLAFLSAPFTAMPPPTQASKPAEPVPVAQPSRDAAPDSNVHKHQTRREAPLVEVAKVHFGKSARSSAAAEWLRDLVEAASADNATSGTIIAAFARAVAAQRAGHVDDALEFEERLIAYLQASTEPSWPLLVCADETFGWRASARARVTNELRDLCEVAHKLLPNLLNTNRWVSGLFVSQGEAPYVIGAWTFQVVQSAITESTKGASTNATVALDTLFRRSVTMRRLRGFFFCSTDLVASLPLLLFGWIFIEPYKFEWSLASIVVTGCIAVLGLVIVTMTVRATWHSSRILRWRSWLRELGERHAELKLPFLVFGAMLFCLVAGAAGASLGGEHPRIGKSLTFLAGADGLVVALLGIATVYRLWWQLCLQGEASICEPLVRRNQVRTRMAINLLLAPFSERRALEPVDFKRIRKELATEKRQIASVKPSAFKKQSGASGKGWGILVALFIVTNLWSHLNGALQPSRGTNQASNQGQEDRTPQSSSTTAQGKSPQMSPSATTPRPAIYRFTIPNTYCGREQNSNASLSVQAEREGKTQGFARIIVSLARGAPEIVTVFTPNAYLIDAATTLVANFDCPPTSPRLAPLNLSFGRPTTPAIVNPMTGGRDGWIIVEELHGPNTDAALRSAVHQAAAWMQADLLPRGITPWDVANFQKTEQTQVALQPYMKARGAEHALVLHLEEAHVGSPPSLRVDVVPPLPHRARIVVEASACTFPLHWALDHIEPNGQLSTAIKEAADCIAPLPEPAQVKSAAAVR